MRSGSHTFIYIARRKIDHLAQLLIIFFTWVSLSLSSTSETIQAELSKRFMHFIAIYKSPEFFFITLSCMWWTQN